MEDTHFSVEETHVFYLVVDLLLNTSYILLSALIIKTPLC